jgi:hypothetical protein
LARLASQGSWTFLFLLTGERTESAPLPPELNRLIDDISGDAALQRPVAAAVMRTMREESEKLDGAVAAPTMHDRQLVYTKRTGLMATYRVKLRELRKIGGRLANAGWGSL